MVTTTRKSWPTGAPDFLVKNEGRTFADLLAALSGTQHCVDNKAVPSRSQFLPKRSISSRQMIYRFWW